MAEVEQEGNAMNPELLQVNNKKYKAELARLDIQVERLEFENQLIYDKLKKAGRSSGKIKMNMVEKSGDVDLNFNTKVNYVEHLQKRLTGK